MTATRSIHADSKLCPAAPTKGQLIMTTALPTGQPPARVAVVGVGAVTSLGPTARDLWEGARDGRVAIDPVQRIDMGGFQTKIGGEVQVVPTTALEYPRPDGHRERALDLALAAAEQALAPLPAAAVPPDRLGLVLGTCNAGLLSAREWLRRDQVGEPADARLASLVTPGALADALAAAFDLQGPVLAVNTACASGANAIGLAADIVRTGRADAVLAGGTDALSDIVFAGFSALESLSATPAAPYSANRDGLSLGEGAAMVLLMSADLAARHGLQVLAEVAGYGLSADGHHPTAPRPDGTGAAVAIRAAMRSAGVRPSDIGYVNGHGTGTPKNDPAETKAIQLALGGSADQVLVSSTKSMIGHLLGAAGAAEAIVTVGALAEQVAPPTAGFLSRDPDCPLDYVPNRHRALTTDVALSNNFAFGGANACLVLARPGARPAPPVPLTDSVVITGVCVVSPAGDGLAAAWSAYESGRTVHRLVDGVRQATVDLDPEPYLNRRARRRMDRLSVLSVVSAARSLEAAGLPPGTHAVSGCGVLFGTGTGPMEAMERFVRPLLQDVRVPADPGVFPNTVYNQAAGQVAMHLGLYGPTSTLSTGHATGAAVVAYAADLLRAGMADMLVATVTDTLTAQVARAYAAGGLMSTRADAAPADGRLALAEGSVSLVLERRSAAVARGAVVLGEVAGSGLSSDGSRAGGWDVQGRGLQRAMLAALADAGRRAGDVGDVWLAAAGLESADRPERAALTRLFGTAVDAPRRHAPKIVLGDPMGVGPALCLALALRTPVGTPARSALVNASSLTGSHVSLVLNLPTTPWTELRGATS